MKKYLFLISVAAVTMTACTSETEEYVGSAQSQEISFSPIAQKPTRAAVDGTTFPDGQSIYVSAYQVSPTATNFFSDKEFTGSSTDGWKGTTAIYWPLSAAFINFLAYTGFTAGTATWNSTNPASAVVLEMGDNKTAQNDLMYAIGSGQVIQNTNSTLTFPSSVSMSFIHAQALLKFTVKGSSSITVNSITLKNVSCQGTFTVSHSNWDQTSSQSVSGSWGNYDSYKGDIVAIKNEAYTSLTTSAQDYASLMVVPDQGVTGFTINYTLDNKTYNYTYDLQSGSNPMSLSQATKYIYNISFGSHEIIISPTVTDWTTPDAVNVSI